MKMALRPLPRRHLKRPFDSAPVGDSIIRPESGGGTATSTIIIDAHPAFREGVRRHLGGGFTVAGEAATVAELEQLSAAMPDVRLVLIGELRNDALRAAVKVIPEAAKFVVFAEDAGRENVLEALELGASGYLLKSIPGPSLSSTLRGVMQGARHVDASLTGIISEFLERRARRGYISVTDGRRVPVSPREQQVATLLGRGSSTRAIADELDISVVTVRRHISALMRKLQVVDREGVIQLLAA
jgi:DNA-binding NarL/FixJ family response regulator